MSIGGGRVRQAPALALLLAAAACGGGAKPTVTPAPRPGDAVVRLSRDIDAILAGPALVRSTWGVVVDSLERRERIYARNADKLLLPASNVKVITLAAASERLGWDFTFKTDVYAVGPVDRGILYGDLVVVGSGDPSLDDWDGQATRVFTGWADRIKAAGIHVVTGFVVGDDNRLPEQLPGPGWAWDDLDRSFAAAPGALQFNQNTARLTVAPGDRVGDPAVLTIAPFGSGLQVRNMVRTSQADAPAFFQTRRSLGSPTLDVWGTVPIGSLPLIRNVSAHNPTRYFVDALREVLVGAGIDVRGAAVDVDDLSHAPEGDPGVLLLTHSSPPLSTLAVTMMKVSQNLFAESVLAAAGGIGSVPTILSEWGFPPGAAVLVDGSGLSRYNLTTADTLARVLARVHRDDRLREPYAASLPIAGRDGTLANRMAGTAAEGNARAKSGALANARALSGYVTTRDGELLVFSILANNFGTTADVVDAAADAVVAALAGFAR